MKKLLLIILLILSGFLLVTCGDDGLESLSYGDCKTGDRRCSGTKLEICTDYKEWKLETECADSGGTCIPDDGTPHCNVEVEDIPDEIVIFEDEDEVEDDGGSQLLDNFGSYPDENDEEQDDSTVEIDDENTTDTDVENDIDDSDGDDDSDSDEDSDINDSDLVPVCGNEILEGDEVCEKNYIKPCVEINPVKFSGGNAICDETCMDYNTVTCVE